MGIFSIFFTEYFGKSFGNSFLLFLQKNVLLASTAILLEILSAIYLEISLTIVGIVSNSSHIPSTSVQNSFGICFVNSLGVPLEIYQGIPLGFCACTSIQCFYLNFRNSLLLCVVLIVLGIYIGISKEWRDFRNNSRRNPIIKLPNHFQMKPCRSCRLKKIERIFERLSEFFSIKLPKKLSRRIAEKDPIEVLHK